ncbi:hypothetical protein, variant [Verruconis gallopava]|uniref:Aminotransferase class V domain-containing protein n=1 Tax=Verruconis gallopava TaxID=253628 RepID=A0A0D2APT9_9PEZI|nr:uncharacterized protein PV09_00657 [Verruconis gallopava]XP_016218582.1 hypothetical protein, variant [Verruconis gallopava]KIW08712.1 hypothetical protein PV09_00657 [Verruconis gallopava]KIW08713.1 hypothetical protein, variant [Verruconis gallopava]
MAAHSSKKFGHALKADFLIEPKWRNLNHGSFGTYPRQIQQELRRFQDASEARADAFIRYDSIRSLDASREAIARLLNAPVEACVFVQNATTGINTVLRNLVFHPGDKIVYFDTIYGACERTISYITETTPAQSVKVKCMYPVSDKGLVDEFKRVVKEQQSQGFNVRIAVFDTVVSMPGVRVPFEALTEACRELGVLSCIDAAHGVGHIELNLAKLDPDFFVSNCHKWLYTPRGCAVFYVPVRNQHLIRSTVPTSHGFQPRPKPGELPPNNPLPPNTKSPFVANFEFMGTIDIAPYLCVPAAIRYRESLGGEKAILQYCHDLSRQGGDLVAKILGTKVLENEDGTLGNCCLRNVKLPLDVAEVQKIAGTDSVGSPVIVWMTATMTKEYDTFMALMFYDDAWWVRFSSQVYLELSDYEWAAKVLIELCARVKKGEFLEPSKEVAKL